MDTGYPRIFEITSCEKHREMHHDVRCADCEIDRLRHDNAIAKDLLETMLNGMTANLTKDNTIDLDYDYWIRRISAFLS